MAKRGLYTTDPNPRVGCVIVKNERVVGEGWHHRAGEAHAEINALNAAGAAAQGADCYVTLEPCSHFGRTPPCAEALIRAGIKRLFVAMSDPNPIVAGTGLERLQKAGIEVHQGLFAAQAEQLNPGFCQRMRVRYRQLPRGWRYAFKIKINSRRLYRIRRDCLWHGRLLPENSERHSV